MDDDARSSRRGEGGGEGGRREVVPVLRQTSCGLAGSIRDGVRLLNDSLRAVTVHSTIQRLSTIHVM